MSIFLHFRSIMACLMCISIDCILQCKDVSKLNTLQDIVIGKYRNKSGISFTILHLMIGSQERNSPYTQQVRTAESLRTYFPSTTSHQAIESSGYRGIVSPGKHQVLPPNYTAVGTVRSLKVYNLYGF